jgi:hypothetical protein
MKRRWTCLVILISFDIDGTLEVGDPPGVLTMEMVRKVQEKEGFLIGSCSDRPPSSQLAIWEEHHIKVDFVSPKHMLAEVKTKFQADAYVHIGDREDLDHQMALRAGFEFLWPDEAAAMSWFDADGDADGAASS